MTEPVTTPTRGYGIDFRGSPSDRWHRWTVAGIGSVEQAVAELLGKPTVHSVRITAVPVAPSPRRP